MRLHTLFCVMLLSAASCQQMPGAESQGRESQPDRVTPHPQFEMIKKLEGEWTGTGSSRGKVFDDNVTVTYEVSSVGFAVVETPYAGTVNEMITVYYVDGSDLVLTHYCAAGNQPRLRADRNSPEGKLVFRFAGGTNLDPAKDDHMHDLTMEFVGPDRLRCVWTSYSDGIPSHDQTFELKRKE